MDTSVVSLEWKYLYTCLFLYAIFYVIFSCSTLNVVFQHLHLLRLCLKPVESCLGFRCIIGCAIAEDITWSVCAIKRAKGEVNKQFLLNSSLSAFLSSLLYLIICVF